MKRIWKEYFSFSKKERIAVILLLLLTGVFIALPYFFSVKDTSPVVNPELREFLSSAKKKGSGIDSNETGEEITNPIGEKKITEKVIPFPFDPNAISVEDWIRLGLRAKTAQTIINYRNKGGHFNKPEDLRKIWGITKVDADRLIGYVRIGNDHPHFSPGSDHKKTQDGNSPQSAPVMIDINTATADEWKILPGIGEMLAKRIVNYRERVSGFTGITQVKKIYGLGDSVFQAILPFLKSDPATAKKTDLNKVSANELAERTGISGDVARAIIVYRQQYGFYHSVDDLKKIVFITDSLFQRIKQYVVAGQ